MRKSKIFLTFTVAEILLLFLFYARSSVLQPAGDIGELSGRRELVRSLSLTDFAIWTEARYTRHPSQADFFSPFQDFPSSFEHFPAGSVIAPVVHPGGAR